MLRIKGIIGMVLEFLNVDWRLRPSELRRSRADKARGGESESETANQRKAPGGIGTKKDNNLGKVIIRDKESSVNQRTSQDSQRLICRTRRWENRQKG
jgi:hypothetical protein